MSVQDHFTPSESDFGCWRIASRRPFCRRIIQYNTPQHRHEDIPSDIQDTTTTAHQNKTKSNAESDEIPALEEDWDNSQFDDAESTLITHHNTYSESQQIRWNYTQQLLDLTDN